MVNQDSKLRPIQSLFPFAIKISGRVANLQPAFNVKIKGFGNRHFAETFAKRNKAIKKYFVSCHEFCVNLEIWSKIVMWLIHSLDHSPFSAVFYTYVLRALCFV